MRVFEKPKVVLSRCLGFEKCRWNGETIPDSFIEQLKPFVDFLTVCPEVKIGLGVPRKPIRLVREGDEVILYQPATERRYTSEMVEFTEEFLSSLEDVDGFILKFRSPTLTGSSSKY